MSRAKKKGTEFEVACRDYFRDNGFPDCERLPTEGAKDRGDLAGVPITISCKNYTDYSGHLGEWCREAHLQAITAKKYRYAVLVKRRQASVQEAFAVVPMWVLAELMVVLDERTRQTQA